MDSTPSLRARALTDPAWADRRLAAAVALAITAGFGLLLGWRNPRGPLTIAESLGTMLFCLLLGVAARLVRRSPDDTHQVGAALSSAELLRLSWQ